MSRPKTSALDDRELHLRVLMVIDVLNLHLWEKDQATASEEGLIEFARRHNQSLDWLLENDPRPMIRERKARAA